MIIKTWRDPYDAGFSPTKPTSIELHPGLTVLVGCNGAGKSTLLLNIQEHCKDNEIPCHLYDNLSDGGHNSLSSMFYEGNYGEVSFLMTASEGECIKENLSRNSTLYKDFLGTGFMNTKKNKFAKIFMDDDKRAKLEDKMSNCKERVLLFDAVDSGLSVDSIVEVKDMFTAIEEDSKQMGMDVYIVIAANEYELARNSNCFDVNDGKYVTFADYEEYRNFVINSRLKKEKRIEKQKVWYEKRRQRAEARRKKREEKYLPKIEAIEQKAREEGRELSWREKSDISDYKRMIEQDEY